MKERFPPKDEQIEALLHAKGYDLTMKYAGRDETGSPQYEKVFNVTREEVESYARAHYKPSELPFVRSLSEPRDGEYIIKIPNGYQVYYQERNIRTDEHTFLKDEDVWKWYLDRTLSGSGTGITRRWKKDQKSF